VYDKAFAATVGCGRFYLYDHFGSLESDNLIAKLRYLATGCGCDFIVVDHISIAVSGIEDGDERRIIDNLMTKLRSLVEQTGVGMLCVCHLKNPTGGGATYEEGKKISLNDLRGSGGIKQMSDTVIGMERDQQAEDGTCDISTIRVLKCRFTGDTGAADTLEYSKKTGRLLVQGSAIPEGFTAEDFSTNVETPPVIEKLDFE
jgi:twinkle protein